MHKRIQINRDVMKSLSKLERKQVFVDQFSSAQEFLEWSLKQALHALDKRPFKPLKRIDS